MITLKFLGKYWTLIANGQPILEFASFEAAISFAPEANVAYKRAA